MRKRAGGLKSPNRSRQERFYFESKIWFEAQRTLDELFQFKCAYCEKDLIQVGSLVNHFRPFGDCVGLRGKTFRDGYWWLAYEWDNLYPVCKECASIKGNRFPIVLDKYGSDTDDLHRTEKAILIDPCYDTPEQYLLFHEDGTVTKTSGDDLTWYDPNWESEFEHMVITEEDKQLMEEIYGLHRGAVTIELLGLNRVDLIGPRKDQIQLINQDWNALLACHDNPKEMERIKYQLRRYLGLVDRAPFTGMARQLIGQRIKTAVTNPSIPGQCRQVLSELASELEKLPSPAPVSVVGVPQKPVGKKAPAKKSIGTSTSYITEIEIKNFKSIKNLKIEIPGPIQEEVPIISQEFKLVLTGLAVKPDLSSDDAPKTELQTFAPWKVLLGENGSGKSSVLQALAMTFNGV